MSTVIVLAIILTVRVETIYATDGLLFPRESETRELKSLNGIWNFVTSPESDPLIGFRQFWYKNSLKNVYGISAMLMPVPASYNDITQDAKIRDFVGIAWYDRDFFVPKSWQDENKRVWLRFSSVSYAAQVVSWRNSVYMALTSYFDQRRQC